MGQCEVKVVVFISGAKMGHNMALHTILEAHVSSVLYDLSVFTGHAMIEYAHVQPCTHSGKGRKQHAMAEHIS